MTPQERHQYYLDFINPQLDRLGRLICEASEIDDSILGQSHYQDLLAFYEEQISRGYWHPRLAEAVADFTASNDATAALPYYRLALEQARALEDDTQTILIAMAEALFEIGQTEQAEACLHDGRAEALRRGDEECVREADRVLRDASS
jgi:thioredoxin-like negative regulator of GroEL